MPIFYKGKYHQTIDADDRVVLPSAIRQVSDSNQYVITRGFEACVFLYPIERWKEMVEEIGQLNEACREARHFYRVVLMWAFDTETGKDGRIEIPTGLKDFAKVRSGGAHFGRLHSRGTVGSKSVRRVSERERRLCFAGQTHKRMVSARASQALRNHLGCAEDMV